MLTCPSAVAGSFGGGLKPKFAFAEIGMCFRKRNSPVDFDANAALAG
jgi:hypothetical protein